MSVACELERLAALTANQVVNFAELPVVDGCGVAEPGIQWRTELHVYVLPSTHKHQHCKTHCAALTTCRA